MISHFRAVRVFPKFTSCLSQLSSSVDIPSYEDEVRRGSVLAALGCSSHCLENLFCLHLLCFLRTLLCKHLWPAGDHLCTAYWFFFATLSLFCHPFATPRLMLFSSFLNTGQGPLVFPRSSHYSPAFSLEAKVSKKEGENMSQTPLSHMLLEMVDVGLEHFCVSRKGCVCKNMKKKDSL